MQYEYFFDGSEADIFLSGCLDGQTGSELVELLAKAIAAHPECERWCLNLGQVELKDGSGMISLLRCLQLALRHRVRLQLSGMTRKTQLLLRISRVHSLFEQTA
ncbi:MAG: STAS domain-containing protein [Candidatus Sericytochromatia bacterium]|nr:STAS domain-containing protein [Candidatus Sericytochromatia bacterium]